jgi:hypothetical protein
MARDEKVVAGWCYESISVVFYVARHGREVSHNAREGRGLEFEKGQRFATIFDTVTYYLGEWV